MNGWHAHSAHSDRPRRRPMNQIRFLAAAAACATLMMPRSATAQTPAIPPALTTPDRVESRIGPLDFKDGAPSTATLDKIYDAIDFAHAQSVFADTMKGVSLHAIRKGLQRVGVKDNEAIIFSELMDAKSLWLTTNADTIYAVGALDLTKGPIVLETAPGFLGAIQDYWFGWITDIGLPGPDRGEGGKYLVVPPGYDGPLPQGGFSIAQSKTNYVLWFARSFLANHNDPKPVADTIRKFTKIYPYDAGGLGLRRKVDRCHIDRRIGKVARHAALDPWRRYERAKPALRSSSKRAAACAFGTLAQPHLAWMREIEGHLRRRVVAAVRIDLEAAQDHLLQ